MNSIYICLHQVDAEIKKILSESYERAKAILKAHAREHRALADALLKYVFTVISHTSDANVAGTITIYI